MNRNAYVGLRPVAVRTDAFSIGEERGHINLLPAPYLLSSIIHSAGLYQKGYSHTPMWTPPKDPNTPMMVLYSPPRPFR
jgi:hypothetical protein